METLHLQPGCATVYCVVAVACVTACVSSFQGSCRSGVHLQYRPDGRSLLSIGCSVSPDPSKLRTFSPTRSACPVSLKGLGDRLAQKPSSCQTNLQRAEAVLRHLVLPRLNGGDCELDALFAAICCLVVQKQTAQHTKRR